MGIQVDGGAKASATAGLAARSCVGNGCSAAKDTGDPARSACWGAEAN